jgi:hypothetical protein
MTIFITLSRKLCPENLYNSAYIMLKHLSDDLPDMQVDFERHFIAFSYKNCICMGTVRQKMRMIWPLPSVVHAYNFMK